MKPIFALALPHHAMDALLARIQPPASYSSEKSRDYGFSLPAQKQHSAAPKSTMPMKGSDLRRRVRDTKPQVKYVAVFIAATVTERDDRRQPTAFRRYEKRICRTIVPLSLPANLPLLASFTMTISAVTKIRSCRIAFCRVALLVRRARSTPPLSQFRRRYDVPCRATRRGTINRQTDHAGTPICRASVAVKIWHTGRASR